MGSALSLCCNVSSADQDEISNISKQEKSPSTKDIGKLRGSSMEESKGDAKTSHTENDAAQKKEEEGEGEDDPEGLARYMIDYAFDEVVPYLEEKKTEFEEENGIQMSAQSVMDFINSCIEFEESPEEAKNWDVKINSRELVLKIKKAGRYFNKNGVPYVFYKARFNEAHKMSNVIQAIHNLDHKRKWDKNLLEVERTPQGDHKGVMLSYQVQKGRANFGNREQVDKLFQFAKDGRFYSYMASFPNSEEVRPPTDGVVRSQMVFQCQRIQRDEEDNSLVLYQLFQADVKMKIPAMLMNTFLPGGIKDWCKQCDQYLNDNVDNFD